ncbi:hypothetical protein G9C98_007882 [Cotesia typhae]|uniref:Angiotensin-converting enzyme n=1 Tax=Cotesia typhae TaxID=2053667 RepID=A0A8J5QYV6_9HYME|nr:hypothetical protein G9C98_007882 [Cotesia typhae]
MNNDCNKRIMQLSQRYLILLSIQNLGNVPLKGKSGNYPHKEDFEVKKGKPNVPLLRILKKITCIVIGLNLNLGEALQFLREYDQEASAVCNKVMTAQWNFATNVTDLEEQTTKLKFERSSWRKAVNFAWTRVPDPLARRQLKMITMKGRNALTQDKFNEIHHLIVEMKELHSRARLCPYKKTGITCDMDMTAEVSKIMAQSRDYEELLHYWRAWHEAVGPPLKNKYMRYVQLANQAARLNGFTDAGDQMREAFEDDYFQQNIAEVISSINPLYKNLFTYVRTRLIDRIKQCTKVTMEDLLSTHHEMSHIQYYLQYKDQPFIFRNEALPGFHEAISDAIELSVMNPRHFQRIGLYNNSTEDYESNINFLMLMALRKVVYLPFAYIIDQVGQWRWRVFSDGVADMTTRWWELRLQYQGIVPPLPRLERDFDPGAKYHIPADIPYTKYFVGAVLQFQLFESLCDISGHVGELHLCDIYRSQEAGRLLSEILSQGSSRNWHEIVQLMTRGKMDRIDVGPMLRYFEPLFKWLQRQNEIEPIIGWITSQDDTSLFAHWYRSSEENVKAWSLSLLIPLIICLVG